MSNFRVLFLVLFLFACASSPNQQVTLTESNVGHKQNPDQVVKLYNKNIKSKEDRVVCSYTRETGSHFKKRVCKTVAQIEAEREHAVREHGDALLGGMSSTTEYLRYWSSFRD